MPKNGGCKSIDEELLNKVQGQFRSSPGTTAVKRVRRASARFRRRAYPLIASVSLILHIGCTSLTKAVEQNDIIRVRQLIAAGADVNEAVDSHDWRPLRAAVSNGRSAIAYFLLERGASIKSVRPEDWVNSMGDCQDHWSKETTDCEVKMLNALSILRTLLASPAIDQEWRDQALTNLAGAGLFHLEPVREMARVEAAAILINGGANVNGRGDYGAFPLLQACKLSSVESPNIKMIRFLVEKGADVNMSDPDGETAFNQTKLDNLEVLAYLRTRGANENVRSKRAEEWKAEIASETEIRLQNEQRRREAIASWLAKRAEYARNNPGFELWTTNSTDRNARTIACPTGIEPGLDCLNKLYCKTPGAVSECAAEAARSERAQQRTDGILNTVLTTGWSLYLQQRTKNETTASRPSNDGPTRSADAQSLKNNPAQQPQQTQVTQVQPQQPVYRACPKVGQLSYCEPPVQGPAGNYHFCHYFTDGTGKGDCGENRVQEFLK